LQHLSEHGSALGLSALSGSPKGNSFGGVDATLSGGGVNGVAGPTSGASRSVAMAGGAPTGAGMAPVGAGGLFLVVDATPTSWESFEAGLEEAQSIARVGSA